MNVGIYLPGLGEAFEQVSVIRYAELLTNAMDQNNPLASCKYKTKIEKVQYSSEVHGKCTKVTIYSTSNGIDTVAYTFYDFVYSELLIKDFKSKNILTKSFLLFVVVLTKLPILLAKLFSFKKSSFSVRFRVQSMWAILVFFLIAFMGVSLLPGVTKLIADTAMKGPFHLNIAHHRYIEYITNIALEATKWLTVLTSVVYSLLPSSKDLVSQLATEFVCANYYLDMGERKQEILGNLQKLVEFVSENEPPDSTIHLHSYSFGSVIALDLLFPYGTIPSTRTKQKISALITVGCPYDFFNTYYKNYFADRDDALKTIKWINVYSILDALGSNFRNDNKSTVAKYSIVDGILPDNISYELNHNSGSTIINILFFYFIRAHKFYWDTTSSADSCVRPIYVKMQSSGLIV